LKENKDKIIEEEEEFKERDWVEVPGKDKKNEIIKFLCCLKKLPVIIRKP
jgi:hypothetical protein